MLAIKRRSGKVVDAVLAFINQPDQLVESNVRAIVGFEGASRDKTASYTANTRASKSFWYFRSNGTLMKTELA